MEYESEFAEFKHQANKKRGDKDSQYKDNSKRRLINILKKYSIINFHQIIGFNSG